MLSAKMGKHKHGGSRHGHSRGGPKHHGKDTRQSQPQPLSGSALEVTLFAQPEFQSQDHPFTVLGDSSSSGLRLSLESWTQLESLLTWFKNGTARDQAAHLVFSPALGQEHRATIHRLAVKMGLESASRGTGSDRRVSLHAQGHAPAKPVVSEELEISIKVLYALAKEENLTVTRDELAEMLDSKSLPQDLLKLWDTRGREQVALYRMNSAASKGNLEELKALIQEHPDIVKSGQCEMGSKLAPMGCAAAQGRAECLQALLDAGAPVDTEDGYGMPPLQVSRKFEQMDTEALLLRAGAKDPEAARDFKAEASLSGSVSAPEDTASPSNQPAQEGVGKPKAPLEQAVSAKPFVPRNGHKDAEEEQPAATEASPASMSHAETSSREQAERNADEQARPSSEVEGKASAAAPHMPSSAEAERKEADAKPSPSTNSQAVRSSFENMAGPAIRAPDTPDKEAGSQRPSPPLTQTSPPAREGDEPPCQQSGPSPPAREASEPPRRRSGPHVEVSQPPAVPGQVSRKVAAFVGGRSRSGQLPEGLLKEYNGPPNLRGDPRTATRGRPGASAVALGRRIIENANAEMHRYGSAGLSGDLDKFHYTEPSQPPAVKAGKLSGVPNVVGGRGVEAEHGSNRVQLSRLVGRPEKTGDRERRDNKQRVNAWMESASEEHSSTPLSDTGGSLFSSTADRAPRRSLSEPRYLSSVGAEEAPAPKPLGSEFGVPSMKAGDTEEGPQYQDPRQLEGPSQPPVAVGAASPAVATDAPAQPGTSSSLNLQKPSQPPNLQAEEATKTATPSESKTEELRAPPAGTGSFLSNGRSGFLTAGSDGAEASAETGQDDQRVSGASEQHQLGCQYMEGTQPPTVVPQSVGQVPQSVSQIPAMVGGRQISGQSKDGQGDTSCKAQYEKPATYGQPRSSATALGKRVIEDPAAEMNRHRTAGRAGDLDSFAYVEPSQPPTGPTGKLLDIPNVVGGRAVAKQNTEPEPGAQPPTAAHSAGNGDDLSAQPAKNVALTSPAEVEGEALHAVAPSPEEVPLSVAQSDIGELADMPHRDARPAMQRISEEKTRRSEGSDRPSLFEFATAKLPPEPPLDTTNGLLDSSRTAAMFGRPKGLGAGQALPQKPPSRAAARAREASQEAEPPGVTGGSTPGALNLPASILASMKECGTSSLERLSSSVQPSTAEASEGDEQDADESLQYWTESWSHVTAWAKANQLMLASTLAAGAVAVYFVVRR